MINQKQVLARIQEYLAYSKKQKPQFAVQYTNLCAPISQAVVAYFKTIPSGMKEVLEDYVHESYCDYYNREVKYENPVDVTLPTNYPNGYDDIRKCFYGFPWMSTTPEAFFAAWVEGVPEASTAEEGGTPPTQPPEPISHPMLDAWVAELGPQPDEDLKRVKALTQWFKSSSSSVNMVNLLEDQGVPSNIPSTQDVANVIYLDRRLLEVIRERKIDAYVPTYLKDAELPENLADWVRPNLTAKDTQVGGGKAACRHASNSKDSWVAFDGTVGDGGYTADCWISLNGAESWLEFYNPDVLKVESIEIQNRAHPTVRAVKHCYVMVSSDGNSYEKVTEAENPSNKQNASFTIPMNGVKCRYIKVYCDVPHTSGYAIGEMKINAKRVLDVV